MITRDVPAATAAGTGCPPSPPGPTPGETGAPGGAAGVAPPATAASDAALVDCAALGTGAPGLAATAVAASSRLRPAPVGAALLVAPPPPTAGDPLEDNDFSVAPGPPVPPLRAATTAPQANSPATATAAARPGCDRTIRRGRVGMVASLAARTPGGEVRSSSSDDRRRGAVPGAVHRREVNRR